MRGANHLLPGAVVSLGIGLFLLFMIPVSGLADTGPVLSFRISGGLGYLLDGGGDIEKLRADKVKETNGLNILPGHEASSDWNRIGPFPDTSLELIFHITRHFGLGFGAGYLSARSKGDYSESLDYYTSSPFTSNHHVGSAAESTTYSLSAIPLYATTYFYFPLSPAERFQFFLYAGVGYFLGRLKHEYSEEASASLETVSLLAPDTLSEEYSEVEGLEETTCNRLGFRGGLGLEFRAAPSLSLGLEFYGRYVDFNNWQGTYDEFHVSRVRMWQEGLGWIIDETTTERVQFEGFLWHQEHYNNTLVDYLTEMNVSDHEPSSIVGRNIRKAALNLNALGILFSIRLSL